MDFERLLLTKNCEFYRFSRDYDDVAYLLIIDTFSKATVSFGKQFFDDDFEPRENQIIVKVFGIKDKGISETDREELNSFVESLLSFKPSIDYVVEFEEVSKELEFDYPSKDGFIELIEKIDKLIDAKYQVKVKNVDSFNNLLQN